MVSIEAHTESVKSFLDDIEEKLRTETEVKRQKIIGFFSSEKTADIRFDFDFPSKNRLIPLLVKQEKYRNLLCYGRQKEKKLVTDAIENVFEIKKIVEMETGEKI